MVIMNLEFKISSVDKLWEHFGQETILGILFGICLIEYDVKLNEILMRISKSKHICIREGRYQIGISAAFS